MEELYAKEGGEGDAKSALRKHLESIGVEWDGQI